MNSIFKNLILEFWKENENFWIPISEKEKELADKTITEKFYNYNYGNETVIGKIIYLDQFYRHFQRFGIKNPEYKINISEEEITRYRMEAFNLSLQFLNDPLLDLKKFSEMELIFLFMPCKHLGFYDMILSFLEPLKPLEGKMVKFYNDTYRKTYTFDRIKANIEKIEKAVRAVKTVCPYNSEAICDYYPEEYSILNSELVETHLFQKELVECFKPLGSLVPLGPLVPLVPLGPGSLNQMILSLSGGVDSMVMAAILKHLKIPFVAVHILYGNREESSQECEFISEYCRKLNITLYVYRIQYLKRSTSEREFYEEMTRDIRFNVYKAIGEILGSRVSEGPKVLLGHIQEDVIENIWSNLAKCQHLHNLKKMKVKEVYDNIVILRPFLNITKDNIYKESISLGIPYLKNTTPSWSNRGKFRTRFINEVYTQFGKSVDSKMLELSDKLEKQNSILENLLYKPIFKSFNELDKSFDITPAINANVSENEWSYIFEKICYKFLVQSKPSIHAIQDFTQRLKKSRSFMMPLKKDLSVKVFEINCKIILQFYI
jgi:tRNA(Ile)-lysidine synthetase-like protein